MSAMLITSHLGSLRDERAVSARPGVFASVFGGMAEGRSHAIHDLRSTRYVHPSSSHFDRMEKLDKMEDGTEIDAVNGGDLFEWVWRHPNVGFPFPPLCRRC